MDKEKSMATACVICGKAKKLMMADYPLSEEIKGERICPTCNQRLKRMLQTKDPAVFRREHNYFQLQFYQSQPSDQAKKLLETYFEIGKSFSGDTSLDFLVRRELAKREREEELEFEKVLDSFMVTTESGFEGYRINRYLDVIFEEGMVGAGLSLTVRSLAGLFSSSINKEVREVADLISQLKKTMKLQLIRQACELGANALIGLDYDVAMTEQASTILVSAKGTAVEIQPIV